MLSLLELAITDGTLSKDHDEVYGEALPRTGHIFERWPSEREASTEVEGELG